MPLAVRAEGDDGRRRGPLNHEPVEVVNVRPEDLRPDANEVAVGVAVGIAVGKAVSIAVGMAVGVAVGMADGISVSIAVSIAVGMAVGMAIGMAEWLKAEVSVWCDHSSVTLDDHVAVVAVVDPAAVVPDELRFCRLRRSSRRVVAGQTSRDLVDASQLGEVVLNGGPQVEAVT